MNMAKTPVIGIDFGTSKCCVGVFRNGRVEMISNDLGNPTTPFYVAFNAGECLIGETAKNQMETNLVNTLYNIKRLLGRKFEDASVQQDIKELPFKVVNVGGKPQLCVEYDGENQTFSPEDICAIMLANMKIMAETYLNETVTDAVVTIPANFNDSQRRATLDAAKMAGLRVISLIDDPTAAAIACILDKRSNLMQNETRNLLVYDLGGGCFDSSFVTVDDGIFEVKSTAGDTHLGGDDFTNRMVTHFVKEYKKKYRTDIGSNKRSMCLLQDACERAKIELSSSTQASIEIESLFDDVDFYTTISREKFEKLNDDLFKKTIKIAKKGLRYAKMNKNQIHLVVLVGGSTLIPKIVELLKDCFAGVTLTRAILWESVTIGRTVQCIEMARHLNKDNQSINQSINLPDKVLIHGTAVFPELIKGDEPSDARLLVLVPHVAPFTLKMESGGGVMSTIIKKNTPSTVVYMTLTTLQDGQTTFRFRVLEGDGAMANGNNLLGSFEITGISTAFPNALTIKIKFAMNFDGILDVSAFEIIKGYTKKLILKNNMGGLNEQDLDRKIIIDDAEKHKRENSRQVTDVTN